MVKFSSFAVAALAAGGALFATLPAAVAEPAHGGGACFYLNQVSSSRLVDARTLLIRAGNRYFRMQFSGQCNDMGTEPVILHPFDNSGQVCSAIGVDVRIRGTGQICNPSSLSQMTPEEVAAIPARDRP